MDRDFGRAQRRILLATMCCYLFYYTGRQTFGSAIPGIQEDLGIGEATLGWAATALLWSYAIGQAVNGFLGDVVGARRMMSAGAILSCLLNWVVSFGRSFAALAIPWAVNGYAQAMGWAPGSRVLSNWWGPRHRGTVYGCYVFAAGLSSVLSFVTALVVIDTLALDWEWIFRLPVLLLLVAGLMYYLVARDRPEDMGFPPLQESPPERVSAAGASEAKSAPTAKYYSDVLTNPRFMVASVAIGFQSVARYGLIFWVPVHFLGENWKQSEDKWVSIALPVGMALGALASGWLSDRLFRSRRWPVISLFMSLAAISSFTMYAIPRDEHLLGVIVLFLCGFFAYGPQAAFWALCPDLLGSSRAGTGTGIMNTHAYVFAGLGEPLLGWVIESHQVVSAKGSLTDDTSLVFLVVGIACVASAAIAGLIRR